AGFSTYESMYRAKAVFCVKRAIVVTQKYHESRALYVGEKLGLDVWGVTSDQAVYHGQTMRDLREVVARDKDFIKCIYKPEPTFLGEQIPITGEGNI
ncbi:MAG: YdcF family protein, partial [Firmicutes bacterium]|nr:YdcF family protein [Bacillota bacterium]